MYDIGDPYVIYRINVTVQQLDYRQRSTEEAEGSEEFTPVWRTVGYAVIGPERIGENTNNRRSGLSSGPEVRTSIY